MEIIELMNKQNALECEVAEMKRRFPMKDKEESLRFVAAKKEIDALEAQICAMAKEIVEDPSLDYSQVTEDFANDINDAAERGVPIEEVLFGKDSILDSETANCSFKLLRAGDGLVVMGGLLTAQCKRFPWLFIKVGENGVSGNAIWEKRHFGRPVLTGSVGLGFHLDGSYQRGVLGFFKRAYARRGDKSAM